MRSIFIYFDGHKCGQTSCPVVGAEIQTNCNFEAHICYFSSVLGCISCQHSILHFKSPYKYVVQLYSCIILPSYLNRFLHKDFLRSQLSSGSSTRSCSTTAGPTECTEHGAIQKGSAQRTVGVVSISCLLFAIFYSDNCNQREQSISTLLIGGHQGNSSCPSLL